MPELIAAVLAWLVLGVLVVYLLAPRLFLRLGLELVYGPILGTRLWRFLESPAGQALVATLKREDGPELVARWGAAADEPESPSTAR